MLKLKVHEVRQNAGGGSSVVIYDADIHLHASGPVTVHVQSIQPEDADPVSVEEARQAILSGAEHVLNPLGKGASIQVHGLVVHAVDFKPSRFKLLTALQLGRALSQ